MTDAELLDDALAADARDALAHDRRTEALTIDVEVRGRVAHVAGTVPSAADRERVRGLVRRVEGTLAVWDRIALDDGRELVVLDVGSGGRRQVPEAVSVDVLPAQGVDVVADLDEGLPFEDGSVDCVFAVHVLEHVRDLLGVMRELHRVLRPDGVLHALCPHRLDANAYADPTHVRLVDPLLFRYFCLDKPGVASWRPLGVAATRADVFADLQPLPAGELAGAGELARWFR